MFLYNEAVQRSLFKFWKWFFFFLSFFCCLFCANAYNPMLRHSSTCCDFSVCGGMTHSPILEPVSRICCPLTVATVIFSPYLSSRCWEVPCTGTAAKRPKRLMHPGREKQTAVGLLLFKTTSPPSIHPLSLPCYPILPPATPQRKKVQAIKSAQMLKHLLGAFQDNQEHLNSSWVTIWEHFLGMGDRDLERDKRR